MFDPVTNLISNQSAQRAAQARRPQEARSRASEKGARPGDEDRFESILNEIEPIGPTRPLADADQEEAREDRAEHRPGNEPKRGSLDVTA